MFTILIIALKTIAAAVATVSLPFFAYWVIYLKAGCISKLDEQVHQDWQDDLKTLHS